MGSRFSSFCFSLITVALFLDRPKPDQPDLVAMFLPWLKPHRPDPKTNHFKWKTTRFASKMKKLL
jgi:hypothetical protein